MAKCVCGPNGKPKSSKKGVKSGKVAKGTKSVKGPSGKGKSVKGSSGGSKIKRKGHPANMFILYFLDMFFKYRGNMYCMAKECGKRWWKLPQSVKDKYKRQYCANCKNCKSCTRPKK